MDINHPDAPDRIEVTYRNLPDARIRARTVGHPVPGVPEVVLVQGMAVSDYLIPALARLGDWTRAHLVDLPGLAGSTDPPHEPDIPGYGRSVAAWLDAAGLGRVVVAGHSSGTQVAAHAAAQRPDRTAALVLASPTVDPIGRSLARLLLRWRLDSRHEPGDLGRSHQPEWVRAGPRRLLHIVRAHLADHIEDMLGDLPFPVLVLRGRQDRLLTDAWARELARMAPDGRFVEVPGAHTFVWPHPDAWSKPIRDLALESVGMREGPG